MRTKKDFLKFFRAEILPEIQKMEKEYFGRPSIDHPLRREEWNNIIDAMVTDRELPKHAIEWSCPW